MNYHAGIYAQPGSIIVKILKHVLKGFLLCNVNDTQFFLYKENLFPTVSRYEDVLEICIHN